MKIVPLLENKRISKSLVCKHGLSLYIEANNHKILVDVGPDDSFIKNAKTLGINLAEVDYLIISHGHSDHGGGLRAFLAINHTAKVVMSRYAFGSYYAKVLGPLKISVGLDQSLQNHPQIECIEGTVQLADTLLVFDSVSGDELVSTSNNKLLVKGADKGVAYSQDTFRHEIYLSVTCGDQKFLFSSCSHRGMVNILQRYQEIEGRDPDYVYAGLHLYNPISRKGESSDFINSLGKVLERTEVKTFYTFHCTGDKAYKQLQGVLSHRVQSLSTGSVVDLGEITGYGISD